MTAIRSAPGLDVRLRHAQPRRMQAVSHRGGRGVLLAAILALLALGVAMTFYPVLTDSIAAARDRDGAAPSAPFEAGMPGSPVAAIRYRLVAK
jgi:hypothetical protein